MIRPVLALCLGLVATLLSSCVQRLPNANDMDQYYKVAEAQCQGLLRDLEKRRAEGKLSDADYRQEKAAIQNTISMRAADLAWTSHDLREKEMEVHGLPTPDHPQEIMVPEAGALPTGSNYRRFNQNDMGNTGGDTINTMRQMMGSSTLGQNVRPMNSGR